MKMERLLQCDMNKIDRFIQMLADQDAGKHVSEGMKYKKKISGMNGHEQLAKVEIKQLKSGCYAVVFKTKDTTIEMTYHYEQTNPDTVRLVYEEETHSEKTLSTINQKLGSLLFGHTAKKQLKRRLDAFEAQLEAYDV